MKTAFYLGIILVSLAGCVSSGTDQQTLEAYNSTLNAQLSSIQTTATVERERLLVTIEHAETRVAHVSTQQREMLSTLEERGVDTSILPSVITEPAPASNNDLPTPAIQVNDNRPPVATPPAVTVTQVQVTPFTVTPEAVTPEAQQANLTDLVTSRRVGNDDCALDITNQFESDTQQIYVVARAVNIQAGMTITSTWWQNGTQVATFDFAPDFDIENACIWFFAEQSDFQFAPGNYQVALQIQGTPVEQAIQFAVVESMNEGS